jgi:cytochrome c oxidase cbb3-type subunit II
MAGSIYNKPVTFAVAATVVVLVGTMATMAYPMLRADMHPRVEGLKPLSPLELAGRDVYQREGCMGCHTQTVRPLRSEVVRYGGSRAREKGAQYSVAGEFADDHPFLWGSKRTGPDLAFEGWIKPAAWHAAHLVNPQAVVPSSNMPAYAFLKDRLIDPFEVQAHMRALRRVGVPYPDSDIMTAARGLQGKTELDGLVAYLASLGRAVDRGGAGGGEGAPVTEIKTIANPMAGNPAAVAKGQRVFAENCAACHGDKADGLNADGSPAVGPSLLDDTFLGVKGDLPEGAYLAFIKAGSDGKKALGRPGLPDGGMPAFADQVSDDDLWSVLAWIRTQKPEAR